MLFPGTIQECKKRALGETSYPSILPTTRIAAEHINPVSPSLHFLLYPPRIHTCVMDATGASLADLSSIWLRPVAHPNPF